ncbi:MAG TPA: MBL fold metallo-hydrolase [Candidatus Omnitrophota bacterium]|nr:MBL fold metallo-hydrolase [Candidatus Omnitrophota bacterium]
MKAGNVELEWLGHASFLIKTPDNKIIYIDPYQLNSDKLEKADMILITHSHPDHCSIPDLNKIIKPNSRIVLTADCQSKIMKMNVPIKIEIAEPGNEFDFGNIRILSTSAYNINKSFHPKGESWVGYVIKINGTTIYHAGDTDVIPEMQKLTGHKSGSEFVALLPIGGRFTMNVEEAFEAAKIIKPNLAIPMHWGGIVGSREDAEEFVRLCKEKGIEAVILEQKN